MLRNKEMNIKDWKLHELSELVKEVAIHEPKQLKTFFNFADVAFNLDYYEMSLANFQQITDLFVAFVSQGHLGRNNKTNLYYRYILLLEKAMFPRKMTEE
jgi:hypothetical protein